MTVGKWFAPPSGGYSGLGPNGEVVERTGPPPKVPAIPEGVRARATARDEATNGDDPIPRYAQLDLWMALYGSGRSEEYGPFRDQHGFAETWARLCDEVRTARAGEAEPVGCYCTVNLPHIYRPDLGCPSLSPITTADVRRVGGIVPEGALPPAQRGGAEADRLREENRRIAEVFSADNTRLSNLNDGLREEVERLTSTSESTRAAGDGDRSLKATDGIEVPADVAWVHAVPVMHPNRGRLLVPQERRVSHTCEPPLRDRVILTPDGRSGPTDTFAPPWGSTWDCPSCGRVWIVRTHPGEITSDRSGEWWPATWWVARRHRRRARDEL